MSEHLTSYERQLLDFRIAQWIRKNGLISNEISAFQTLQQSMKSNESEFSAKYEDELKRREAFLMELLRDS